MRAIDHLRAMTTNRPLAALIAVGAVSGMGDWLYLTALPILIYQRTGDAVLVGLTGAARLLPAIVLSMPAGLVADRFPQRSILMITEAARAAGDVRRRGAVRGPRRHRADPRSWRRRRRWRAPLRCLHRRRCFRGLPKVTRNSGERTRRSRASTDSPTSSDRRSPACSSITGGLALAFAVNGLTFIAMLAVLALAVPGLRRSDRTPSRTPTRVASASPPSRDGSPGPL